MIEPNAPGRALLERRVALFGYAGLLPLAVLSLWLAAIKADHVWRPGTILLLTGYGAVVLSFLGGIRWGLVLERRVDHAAVSMGVLPPLAGWAALLTPAPSCFVLLAIAFAAHGAWDSFAAGDEGAVPAWFGRLRIRLTMAAVAFLLLAFVVTA